MREKRVVTVTNESRIREKTTVNRIIPLRIFISVQSGRQHLLAYLPEYNHFQSYRIDYLSNVILEEVTPRFDELRNMLSRMQKNMWGGSASRKMNVENEILEHVEFTVKIEKFEDYIVKRLEREKRIGRVEKIDDYTYRFSAEMYDASAIVPWIRTFICRITDVKFSNRILENKFKSDLAAMYRIYGIEEEATK